MAAVNAIQTVGDFTAVFSHPLVLAGAQIALKGFRLDDMIIHAEQGTPNAKRVVLANGEALALTNGLRHGTLTINAVHMAKTELEGDLPTIADRLIAAVDNIGGALVVSYGMNGATTAIAFVDLRLVSCPPLTIAGNDVATYPVVFTYKLFQRIM